MKLKKYAAPLTPVDILDITLIYEKKEILKFAINYSGLINGVWYQIYRVDNYHGFLHEQKFWRSEKPIPLNEAGTVSMIMKKYIEMITEDYKRFRALFEAAL